MTSSSRVRTAIMISGRGSNMAALVEAAAVPDFPAEVVGVISDKADAPGLKLAAAKNLAARVVAREDFASNQAHESAIDVALAGFDAEIVCLAGYMRLLSAGFVEKWRGRLINIHPALLPSFRGLDTHRRALEAGVRIHGCTVHFVTAEVDDGPIIAQTAVPVIPSDTPESLAERVLNAEHRLYPRALRLLADGRARMVDGRAVLEELDDSIDADASLSSPGALTGPVDLEGLARFTP